jgi:hypothetical protein
VTTNGVQSDTTKDDILGLSMMGTKHYIILIPSLTKNFLLQRPAVLSGDSFLHWIHEKYFGDTAARPRDCHQQISYRPQDAKLAIEGAVSTGSDGLDAETD